MKKNDNTDKSTKQKFAMLQHDLKERGSIAVAFSGGADSALLLKTAHDLLGESVIAVTAQAHTFPERELKEAEEFCRAEGIRQFFFNLEELKIKGFCENPPNRCYLCKKELLKKMKKIAEQQHMACLAEGSNADDLGDYRPGLAAVAESGVISPLQKAGLTKSEIRQLLREMGISVWQKPSAACLASRFAYGEPITVKKLAMVEQAEQLLLEKGFHQARVRIHGNLARIELLPEELERMTEQNMRKEIAGKLKTCGFTYVSMDLEGYRTGSMNEIFDTRRE